MNDDREILEAFLSRLIRGEREAVATLQLAVTRYLYRFGGHRLGDPENVKSEVVTAVVLNLKRQSFTGGNLKQFNAYVRSIALNTVLKDLNQERRIAFGPYAEDHEPRTSDEGDAILDREAVRFILDRIEPQCRELLTLKFLHDLSNAEIADRLRLREVTVRVRIHRCMECTRAIMMKHGLL